MAETGAPGVEEADRSSDGRLDARRPSHPNALEADIAELGRTDDRFRLVVEACPSGMLIANKGGEIVLVNAKIEQMFGYARDELLGRSVDMLVPTKYRRGHHHNREAYLKAPEIRAMGAGRDLRGVRKDGTHGDRAVRPAVVFLDLKLPKIDGLQVLARLRSNIRTRHLPVIILTSSDEPADVERSHVFGVNSYVRKPIEFAQFSETVGLLGTYWLLINEIVSA